MKNENKTAGRTDRANEKREDRLKLALRENLKRRKSQARARDDDACAHISVSSHGDALSGDTKKPEE